MQQKDNSQHISNHFTNVSIIVVKLQKHWQFYTDDGRSFYRNECKMITDNTNKQFFYFKTHLSASICNNRFFYLKITYLRLTFALFNVSKTIIDTGLDISWHSTMYLVIFFLHNANFKFLCTTFAAKRS